MTPILALGISDGWVLGFTSAAIGIVIPDLWLSQKTAKHRKAIQDGLPDALDLIVVCIEAGSSLDQAIVKASGELEIALAGDREGIQDALQPDPCRQAPDGCLQGPRQADRCGRRQVPGGDVDTDRIALAPASRRA